jgi:CDP-diacylglycerol pyrophosphatase
MILMVPAVTSDSALARALHPPEQRSQQDRKIVLSKISKQHKKTNNQNPAYFSVNIQTGAAV